MALALPWFETLDPDADVSVEALLAHIASLGDLHEVRKQRAAADHDAMVEQLARNRAIAAERSRKAMDDETRQLLDEAERWLAAHAEPAP